MKSVALLIALAILFCGCAQVPLTEKEQLDRDYKMQLIYDKWIECREAYRLGRIAWRQTFHMRLDVERGKAMPKYHEMNFDLAGNGCESIVGDWTWEKEEES